MRTKLLPMLALTAACFAGGSACAMNQPIGHTRCHLTGTDKLPAGINTPDPWCSAIDRALSGVGHKPASVEIMVQSPYLASAMVTLADGRQLPAVKVGRSDRPLGSRSIQMLADAIAAPRSADG